MVDTGKVRIVSDFPEKGIQFYDITTILNDAAEFRKVIDQLLQEAKKISPDVIVALESRGFYFGPPLALALNIPFVPIRKKGKLPFKTYSEEYGLEYGNAAIEIHADAMKLNQSVLLVDDVLATGGTAKAAINLINHFEPKKISTLFFLELEALHGRDKLAGYDVVSLATV